MEGAQVERLTGSLGIMLQDPPRVIRVFGRQFRQRRHRHLPGQGQDQQLEQKGKSAARPGPRDFYLLHAAGSATNPLDPGMQTRSVLGVVDTGFFSPRARGTGEFGTLGKVDPIEASPFVERVASNLIMPPEAL